jgi:hypothetical protein
MLDGLMKAYAKLADREEEPAGALTVAPGSSAVSPVVTVLQEAV